MKLPSVVLSCALGGVFALGGMAFGQDARTIPNTPFDVLKREYDQAEKEWAARYTGELTDQQSIERWDSWPFSSFIPKFFTLATSHVDQPYAFDTLKWLIERRAVIDREYYPFDQKIVAQLRTSHFSNPRIVEVFRELAFYVTPAREAFLQECAEKGSTSEVRGLAHFYLGECLRQQRNFAGELLNAERAATSPLQKHVIGRWSPDLVQYVRSIDSGKARAAAQAVYQRTIDEYGSVAFPDRVPFIPGKPTLALMAQFRLGQLSGVAIGQPAPDLVGEDLEGMNRRLSEYQNRVVVLHFWATWCAPCVAKIPHLKQLADKHASDPLSIVGVNFDQDRSATLMFCKEKGISWPSWWALSQPEDMLGRWNVDGSPLLTLSVVDHRGVLRYQAVEGEALDQAVEALLKERAAERSKE